MADPNKTQEPAGATMPVLDGGANVEVTTTPAPPATPVVEPQVVDPPEKKEEPKEEPFPDFNEFLDPRLVDKVKEPEKPVTPVVTPPAPAPTEPAKRDYSDLPPEVQPLFKSMSNDAFNKLKPIYLNAQKLEQAKVEAERRIAELSANRLPENYYENDRAFVLTPEFTQAAQAAQRASAIKQHWNDQLVRIRTGEDIQNLTVNEKGEMQVSGPIKVTPQIEAQVLSLLSQAQTAEAQHSAVLEQLAAQHKTKHTEAKSWLAQYEKESFSHFDDPKNEIARKMAEDTVRQFHSAYRSNPLALPLAKAMVSLTGLANMVRALQQQAAAPKAAATTVNGKPVSQADVRAAGPTATGMASGGKSSDSTITLEDFERVMQGVS